MIEVQEHIIEPLKNESPVSYADRLGESYTNKVTSDHKKQNGQFFTPVEISEFMATLSSFDNESISILDPGCGTGILSIALIVELAESKRDIKRIELTAYETDTNLVKYSQQSLLYLKEWLTDKSIQFSYILHIHDYILDKYNKISENNLLFQEETKEYDIIISNPPYFKLSKEDERTKVANVVVNGHANIYSIFMAIAANQLKMNGELIFITPRSFSSGNYFKTFRQFFFNLVEIEQVHLFVSRKDTFSRDKVLQETLILKCRKLSKGNSIKEIKISSSNGLVDIKTPSIIKVPYETVLNRKSEDKILYVPTNKKEEDIIRIFREWKGSLNSYNIQISTGPVVAHRATEFILDDGNLNDESIAPLFWLHNVGKMVLTYPINKKNKGQFLEANIESRSILIPNRNYIFLRRFSSKDDKSRLIAAPYFSNALKSRYIGVENKVNYIYRPKGHLERAELVGICSLLNSNLFDQFFRIFNGNVNVSATELRLIPLPPIETIKDIGKEVILENSYEIEYANKVIKKKLYPNINI